MYTTTQKDYVNSVNLKAATDFPYLVLEATEGHIQPLNKGFRVMHWHEDLQFIYVLEGRVSVKTLDEEIIITPGQGCFINKYVVHLISYTGNCHYYNFVFPDYFLGFYPGCPARVTVDYLSGHSQLPLYLFDGSAAWHGQALTHLRYLTDLERLGQQNAANYPYEVLVQLVGLWLCMAANINLSKTRQQRPLHKRMQCFLKYIEDHYSEDISLGDLAASANVSKAECLRCFKNSMQITPYQYLIELRLAKAAQLLRTTEDAVVDIALKVGFQQSSHFGKFFKAKTGLSPLAYRRQKS